MSLLALALAAAVSTHPVKAGEALKPAPKDARIRTVDYDPQGVVRLNGVYRTAIQIQFGEDETITHVALGDATSWDVAAETSILFIKPKAAHGATNLLVTTSLPSGRRRSYTFELQTAATRHNEAPLYLMRFRYPGDLKALAETELSAEEKALRAKLTALQLDRGAVEGKRNLAYTVQGSASLQPSEISDNALFTVMRFPAGQAIPAIYQVTPDGQESLVPFDVRGEFVVVHAVPRSLRLRQGSDVLCIYNDAPDPYGVNLGTHTSSPAIERTDRGQPTKEPARD